MKSPRVLLGMMTAVFALAFSVYFEPFLAQSMMAIGFTSAGYLFGVFAVSYTITAFVMGALTKRFKSNMISIVSFLIIAIGSSLLGPSTLYLQPDQYQSGPTNCTTIECEDYFQTKRIYALISLLVLGVGTGSIGVPILIDISTAIKSDFGADVAPKASALFTMSSALGTVLGPIIGGHLYTTLGIAVTSNVMAICSLAAGALYLVIQVWPRGKKDSLIDAPF